MKILDTGLLPVFLKNKLLFWSIKFVKKNWLYISEKYVCINKSFLNAPYNTQICTDDDNDEL